MTGRSRWLRHRASSTPPPFPTRAPRVYSPGVVALLAAESLLLRGAAVAHEVGNALRDGQGPREPGYGRIGAVERNTRFVDEESVAAQGRHSNDPLGCTSNAQRDLEVLVIGRMGDDGEPLPGQRPDERRLQGEIVSVVGNAQVAAGKFAARE